MQPEVFAFLFAGPELILFGIAVLVALQLISGARLHLRDDLLHTTLTVVGWGLITTGILGVLGSLVIVLGVAAIFLWIAAAIVLAEALVKRRVTQRYAFLWVLTVAAERFIPLVPAIEAFARERGGTFADRARHLTRMLTAGVTLPDALEHLRGLLPPGVLPLIRVGYESGALAPALRQAASMRDFHGPVWHSLAGKLVYLCCLLLFGLMIVFFAVWWVVPSFEMILLDFDAELPVMTQSLIAVSELIADHWFLWMPVLLTVFLLLGYTILRYVGLIRWDLPGVNRLVRRLDTAAILEALALVAEHQRPLPEGIASLARSYPKAPVRRRLRAVLRDLDRGTDWCESLHARGLIKRADLAILQAAQRVGNLPWALREMGDSSRRRLAYRLYALVQLLFPAVILTFGLLVMFFVVSLFLPLVTLIQSLV